MTLAGSSESAGSETGSDTGFDTGSDPPSVSDGGTSSPCHDVVSPREDDDQQDAEPCVGQVLDLRHRRLESVVVCGAFSETLERLNVADCQLQEVPAGVWDTQSLRVLNVASNFIERLPDTIGRLQRLKELHIDFNQLRELPSGTGSLSKMTVLTASGNHIEAVPDAVAWLSELQTLRLASNCISQAPPPSFWQSLNNLTRLDLRQNNISGRADFSPLQCLRSLDVSWNHIEQLLLPPDEGNLRKLDCSYNSLQELSLSGQQLETLHSSHNRLHHVTFEPQPSSLQYVDFSSNSLTQVPDWILQAAHLCHLNISHNLLTSVPAKLLGPSLRHLDTLRLNHNNITALPEHTPECHIRHLDLQHNLLENGIPADLIYHSPRLEWLNVSHNCLASLPQPPSKETSLPIRWLLLSITGLTDDALWPLVLACSNLKVLHVAYNQLKTVPPSISTLVHLRDIVLSGNNLRCLPPAIASLPVLESLLLNSNQLEELPNFANINALRVLDVSCNALSQVALSALVSPNLQQLDISCNRALFVDTQEFHHLCSRRNVSVVDTKFSGRLAPPFKPNATGHSCSDSPFWVTGFSESPKGHARLYINQYTQPSGQLEVLAAIVESSQRHLLAAAKSAVADLVREERRCSETSGTFLQNIILATYRVLGGRICCHQLHIVLCHVAPATSDGTVAGTDGSSYEITVAHTGPATCVLGRNNTALNLADSSPTAEGKCLAEDWMSAVQAGFPTGSERPRLGHPCSIPTPNVRHIKLCPEDRLLVISSAALSDALGPDIILREAFAAPHPMAAAKRLGQSISSLVSDAGTCVIVLALQRSPGASPTTQGKSVHFRITTDIDDPDEAEAYKAWEYMLAQNHKLLFNRELETLHRSLVKGKTRHTLGRLTGCSDAVGVPSPNPSLSGKLKKKRYCYGQPSMTDFVPPTNII